MRRGKTNVGSGSEKMARVQTTRPESTRDGDTFSYAGSYYEKEPGAHMANVRPSNGGEFSGKYANILQTLTVLAISISGIYAGIILPLREQINELRAEVARVSSVSIKNLEKTTDIFGAQLKDKISREEHEEFKLREDKQIESVLSASNANKAEMTYFRDNQVTRAENVTHWDQQKENTAEVRKQVDDLRKDFGGQYTISEKIKDLQQQLNEMRVMATPLHATVVNPKAQ